MWSAVTAVRELFALGPTLTDDPERARQDGIIRELFCRRLEDVPVPAVGTDSIVHRVVTKLRNSAYTHETTWHALVWLRWAVQSEFAHGIKPSLWNHFNQWRDDHPTPGMWVLRYASGSGSRGRPVASVFADDKRERRFDNEGGFPLDEFLHARDLCMKNGSKVTRVESKEWKLKRAQRIPTDDDKAKAKEGIRTYRSTEAMQIRCGSHLLKEVTKCVKIAVKSEPKHDFLTGKRFDGRYKCAFRRDDLVEWLQAHFPTLATYSASTLRSAVSMVVYCPRANSKKGWRALTAADLKPRGQRETTRKRR